MKKILYLLLTLSLFSVTVFASPFNEELTEEDIAIVNKGEVLIKNIKYAKNISLNRGVSQLGDKLIDEIEDLKPKYLAEIIQYKPYEGNEDLPQQLETLLNNVPDYAGIPYYSVRHECYYDLYDSAVIKETIENENSTEIYADLEMSPFGTVNEKMNIYRAEDSILYTAVNLNKLRYYDEFDCVKPEKMKIGIFLFRDGDRWVLYGIGGVNAPRIPFFTERIQTSFINRIKTFCNFIFDKF